MNDYAFLTVTKEGGHPVIRRKSAAEVVPESASPVVGTAAGNPAVFSDAAGERVLRSAKVSIEPVQAGSGDPSPDNVRPITGWTGAKVTRCGKNMLDPGVLYTGIGYNPSVGTKPNIREAADHLTDNGDGTFSLSMGAWAHRAFVFDLIPEVPLRFSATFRGANVATTYGYLSVDDVVLLSISERGDSVVKNITFTGTADRRKAFVYFGPGSTAQTVTVDRPQLEPGSVSTEYEPYSGETFDVAFPSEAGTVYGGTVDPAAGTLTVDRVTVALRNNGLNWHASGSYPGGFYADRTAFANVYGIPVLKALTPFVCSHAKSVASVSGYVYGTCFMDYSVNIRIMAEGSTVQDWKDYIQAQYDAGTPVQVCLTLRDPVIYQLTPVQIAALAGLNTVFADCGPVEIEYVRDTGAAIDAGDADTRAMIGEASGETASRSLAVGEYITVGDKLYRVTAAVGSGETLVPGTNVTETTVGAELARIAAMIS